MTQRQIALTESGFEQHGRAAVHALIYVGDGLARIAAVLENAAVIGGALDPRRFRK